MTFDSLFWKFKLIHVTYAKKSSVSFDAFKYLSYKNKIHLVNIK